MKATSAFLSLLFLAATAVSATVPAACEPWPRESPWQWTNEQRAQKRYDENCLAARRNEAGNKERTDGYCTSQGNITDFVFGTDTPELFLPFELFDVLLRWGVLSDGPSADLQRQLFEERVQRAGLTVPPDFWQTVESQSSNYLSAQRAQRQLAASLKTAGQVERREFQTRLAESRQDSCSLRASALAATSAAVGAELFQRLLYTGVAPGLCSSGAGSPAMTLWVASGCATAPPH